MRYWCPRWDFPSRSARRAALGRKPNRWLSIFSAPLGIYPMDFFPSVSPRPLCGSDARFGERLARKATLVAFSRSPAPQIDRVAAVQVPSRPPSNQKKARLAMSFFNIDWSTANVLLSIFMQDLQSVFHCR